MVADRRAAAHVLRATSSIDTPAYFNDVVLGLIEISDDVLLVAGMDIPNIKNVKIGLQTLRLLNTPMSKLHLVLNRANSKVKLDVSEVERTLQVKAECAHPERRRRAAVGQQGHAGGARRPEVRRGQVARAAGRPVPAAGTKPAPSQAIAPARIAARTGRGAGDVPLQAPARSPAGADGTRRRGKRRDPVLDELRQKIHHHLIDELGPILYDKRLSEDDLRRRVHEQLHAALAQERAPLSAADKAQLIQDVSDDILGYGPIDRLLKDEDVTEVMVNGPDIGLRRAHRQAREDRRHASSTRRTSAASSTRSSARSAGASTSRRRMVDARLPDGSRVNAVIHPLAIGGPFLTIRKFSKDPLPDRRPDPVRHAQRRTSARFLQACVVGRLNIIVSGGTGTGKTTTLNVLSSFIPADERIVTVEDAKELQLHQDHVLALEARPPNIEGRGEVTIRDLVKNCLRMRPDRIVVGECRAGEALDMLQAMNTGHDGSITTVHANSPRDTLARLETLVLMAGFDLPVRAIREQMASALDLIVQLTRLRDGTRRITHITEVQGMEGDVITLQDVFLFDFGMGVDEHGQFRGHLKATGVRPKFAEKLADLGIRLGPEVFQPEGFARRTPVVRDDDSPARAATLRGRWSPRACLRRRARGRSRRTTGPASGFVDPPDRRHRPGRGRRRPSSGTATAPSSSELTVREDGRLATTDPPVPLADAGIKRSLVIVLDTSASMADSGAARAAKDGAHRARRRAWATTSRSALVTFDSDVDVGRSRRPTTDGAPRHRARRRARRRRRERAVRRRAAGRRRWSTPSRHRPAEHRARHRRRATTSRRPPASQVRADLSPRPAPPCSPSAYGALERQDAGPLGQLVDRAGGQPVSTHRRRPSLGGRLDTVQPTLDQPVRRDLRLDRRAGRRASVELDRRRRSRPRSRSCRARSHAGSSALDPDRGRRRRRSRTSCSTGAGQVARRRR